MTHQDVVALHYNNGGEGGDTLSKKSQKSALQSLHAAKYETCHIQYAAKYESYHTEYGLYHARVFLTVSSTVIADRKIGAMPHTICSKI